MFFLKYFPGAILFNIHSDDLCDELTILLSELNSTKVPLWKQMRIIEITAAELADRLVEGGTKFEMEPDRVIWPDGTITKKASPPRGKKNKKLPPAVSKHGLYGTIVAQFGNKKKSATASAKMVPVQVLLPLKVHHLPLPRIRQRVHKLQKNRNRLVDVSVSLKSLKL